MMYEIWLIGGMSLVTFLVRYPVIAMSGRLNLSPQFLQLLRYVPPTVLTAIVFPSVLMPDATLAITPTNARLMGAIAALLVGLWQKNLLVTIVVGMAVFFAWQGLLTTIGIA
ncbi:AzlD domain-containing protein [Thermocoleostomius sinensis]|jgi:branched-subunit amino acid transport protein|uniref:AzlD domain-containing protein n=1 Tax=Thermocoleostomius sinensis A174 TaxID=2016057 RepID=A0A9E8ZCF9_9CYAN|nr:AzlD domain-containing protein [Thermocoleostomius sinensis]WAL60337.1 AzlD domain-containing protein [Thermocoleostomius sinensis A174]